MRCSRDGSLDACQNRCLKSITASLKGRVYEVHVILHDGSTVRLIVFWSYWPRVDVYP